MFNAVKSSNGNTYDPCLLLEMLYTKNKITYK